MKKKFRFEDIEDFICNLSLVLMLLAVLANVLSNLMINKRFAYLEEMSTGCYMFGVYAGVGLLYKRRELTVVNFVIDRFPPRLRYVTDLFGCLYLLFYGAMMTYNGVLLCMNSTIKRLPAMQISYMWLDLCIVFGFSTLTIRVLLDIVRKLASAKEVFAQKEAA
ncbi:MAG: TRAP transporter small permease [Clostridiales bacterium]|jgi:TRAP-type C4-dicarboxylate transport system permease small subunit|nr:TRAP transporter small permease [Bacillota bacterium]NLL54475.1 TRAP transporter small permease [Clostridiales bacterium]